MPKGKHSGHVKGPHHYRWNPGKMASKEGYVKIRVSKNNPLADPNGYVYEHLLVWVGAGRPAPESGQLIHHKNGNKSDNRLSNLELKDRQTHNADHNAERFGRPALTRDDATEIRRRRKKGESLKSIAKDYGVHLGTISKIALGERWKN